MRCIRPASEAVSCSRPILQRRMPRLPEISVQRSESHQEGTRTQTHRWRQPQGPTSQNLTLKGLSGWGRGHGGEEKAPICLFNRNLATRLSGSTIEATVISWGERLVEGRSGVTPHPPTPSIQGGSKCCVGKEGTEVTPRFGVGQRAGADRARKEEVHGRSGLRVGMPSRRCLS